MSNDYILLIMNCKKYKDKSEKQKEGWLKKVNIPYFHVIGEPELETPYKFETNVLYVKTNDDYLSLPKKVIAAYEAVNIEYNYKYIFKTDDDQLLTHHLFFRLLMEYLNSQKGIHYGGQIVNVKEDHISKYWQFHPEVPKDVLVKKTEYCNGRFYILSKQVVGSLIKKKLEIQKEYFEDYAIGYNLNAVYKYPIFEIENDIFIDSF